MASAGLTPFYRRPTLEKPTTVKAIREVLVKVAKRRLIATSEELARRSSTAAFKPLPERKTHTCSCECHRLIPGSRRLESQPGVLDDFLSSPTPYQPDFLAEGGSEPFRQFGEKMDTEELDVVGWVSADAVGSPEVLLYIHGYNNSHEEVSFRPLICHNIACLTVVVCVFLDSSNSGSDGSVWQLPQLHSTIHLLVASWKWILAIPQG